MKSDNNYFCSIIQDQVLHKQTEQLLVFVSQSRFKYTHTHTHSAFGKIKHGILCVKSNWNIVSNMSGLKDPKFSYRIKKGSLNWLLYLIR